METNSMHVLIVDDEEEFLSLIRKRLEHRDIKVTTASNATDGVKLVDKDPAAYDVVVMDVRMPGMDGLEGLHRMKQTAPRLPVILLTGHASLNVAVNGMELGAFDYLLKPIAINELIMKLEDAARAGDM